MSATYNWAYRPGVTNKYAFTVPTAADNVRPTGWCYVALFGNDTTGNGSRQYPYKTITKAFSLGLNPLKVVIGSGVYREAAAYPSQLLGLTLIGDGDVIIDISYNGALSTSGSGAFNMYNIQVKGNGSSAIGGSSSQNGTPNIYQDIFFNGSFIVQGLGTQNCAQLINCTVANFSGSLEMGSNSDGPTVITNCTFYNCNNIRFTTSTNPSSLPPTASIFYSCNLSASTVPLLGAMRYCLFFQCNFKMTANTGSGGVLYPSVPSGYTYYSTFATLLAGYTAVVSAIGFTGCTMADPLFNNSSILDLSLSFSSPAKNLSYFGTYIGAKSIAHQIKASVTESTGVFDFSTNVNLTVANDSITLVDTTINAEIKTKLIVNVNGRQILKFPLYGFNADRNGQYIDSIPDLDTVYKNAGDTLSTATPYLVEGFSITYNGNVYQIGDRLTTVSGVITFTSSGAGTLREILEAPERHTIMARFSDGGVTVSAGDNLVIGYWYYVISGSVTYDSVVYTDGQSFKAGDTNTFSGTGTVQIALSTEMFQHYEPGIQPTSNNTGDTRTGSIIRGNGDPAYVRGGYGVQEFPINAKFIQLYYIVNVANLKP